MNSIKNIIMDENTHEIILENENKDIFKMHWSGGDLYWTMLNYHKNNKFCITKESKILFSQIESLFDQIKKYDISHTLLNNKCFEWSSEAYGIPENANKLTITKNNDNFTISFLRNPNNKFNIQNICAVCFCLNGSKNEQITNAFSTMIYEYINNQEENTDKHKTLINKR